MALSSLSMSPLRFSMSTAGTSPSTPPNFLNRRDAPISSLVFPTMKMQLPAFLKSAVMHLRMSSMRPHPRIIGVGRMWCPPGASL